MEQPKTIPRAGTLDTCTNYRELLNRGLDYCQHLGGDLWTDYNEHDPGVTILEQLCYALTDLSYRTDFDIADILAVPPGARQPEQPLYTGDRILPCNALTTADYRKLLYDRIRGLKNAWLVPVKDHHLGIAGLYRILVEVREEVTDESEMERIRQEVVEIMRKARNLAEDLHEVLILKPQPIRVEATIEIDSKAEPANVLAQVLFAIQNSMIPFPQVQLVDELFRDAVPPDQIWNGPLLNHGALDYQSLMEFKETISVDEIAHIILQVPGVKRVKDIMAGSPPGELSRKSIAIRKGHVPRLDPRRIVFGQTPGPEGTLPGRTSSILTPQPSYSINIELEGGFNSAVNSRAVWSKIQELEISMRKNIAYAARSLEALSYLQLPQGKYRNIQNYYSIQHQFPSVYGLKKGGGRNALLENVTWTRQSQDVHQSRLRQLKAYLLFFEQPLADYLEQLAHVGDLFSLDQDLHHSYFYQPLVRPQALPSDPPEIIDVLMQQPGEEQHGTAYYLVCLVDRGGQVFFVTRRLATQQEAQETRRQMIESGQELRRYRIITLSSGEVRLTLHSSTGAFLAQGQERFTSTQAAREAAERWVRFMKDLPNVKHLMEKLVRIFRREDFSLQIIDTRSRIVLASGLMQTHEDRERRIGEILASGMDRRNYRFRALGPGRVTIHLHNAGGNLIAEGKEVFETEFDAEEGVEELIRLLRSMARDATLRELHLRRLPHVEEISKTPLRSYYEGLKQLSEHADRGYLRRRNRILNHLLARFSEGFDDDILERLDLRAFGEKDDFYRDLIRWKIEFLRGYVKQEGSSVALGEGRAQGFDYGGEPGSVSGLEGRVSLLLGMHGHSGEKGYRSDLRQDAAPAYYMEKESHPLKPELAHDEKGVPFTILREHVTSPWREGEPDLHDLHHHFVFASDDSSISQLLLATGTNPGNYSVQERDGKYHILFHATGGEATEVHHAHTRKEADEAIESLVRYFRHLRQNIGDSYAGERMHVLEHILLRPLKDVPARPIHIFDTKSQPRLSSVPVSPENQDELLELIFHHGRHAAGYRVQQDRPGKYYLELIVNEKLLATATVPVADQEEAAALIEELSALLQFLHGEPEKRHEHIQVKDDFYSHRLSVFLPNWPIRFQSKEFKLYAEHLLFENAPAHLAMDCFWLSSNEMQEFEQLFEEWKLRMRTVHGQESAEKDVAALDAASGRLRKMIEMLNSSQRDDRLTGEETKAGQQ